MYEVDSIEYETKCICPFCGEWFGFNPSGVEHYTDEHEYECQHCKSSIKVGAEPTIDYEVVDGQNQEESS